MNLLEFKNSLAADTPPTDLRPALQAMWQDAKGNWAAAHELLQQGEGEPDCDWVHAYLHRKEGDAGNAAYWYRRSSKPVFNGSLEEEWAAISTALLT